MIKIESTEMKMVSTVGGFAAVGFGVYYTFLSCFDTVIAITIDSTIITSYLGQAFFWMTVISLGLFLIRLGNVERFDETVANLRSAIAQKYQNHRDTVAKKVSKPKLANDEKECEHCGGVIKARARKCKHCHAEVK